MGIKMIGMDTSFLIDFLKAGPGAIKFMEEHKQNLYCCEIVVFEFLCGNLSAKEKDTFLSFISRFQNFPCDRSAVIHSSELYRYAKKEGKTTGKPDCLIAGTYRSNGIKNIVTKDVSHFSNLKGVKVIEY